VDEVEAFAAILSLALVNQCDVHIADESAVETGVKYGSRSFPGLSFLPYGLKCMHSFIQGRRVWVLMQSIDSLHAPYVGPPPLKSREHSEPWIPPFSYIRTTVVDLARIWGPIWAASKADTDNNMVPTAEWVHWCTKIPDV